MGYPVWGIDVGIYEPIIDYKELKAQGASFLIARSGYALTEDETFRQHMDGARANGLAFGMYHWLDPLVDANAQADYILKLIQITQPDWFAGDLEQYWASWKAYFDAIYQRIAWDQVPKLAPATINASFKTIMSKVGQGYANSLCYSAEWFRAAYVPQMKTWIGNYPHWVAYYFDYGQRPYHLTWDQFRDTVNNVLTQPGAVTLGATKLAFWQFSSRIILPGFPTQMDCNVWMNDEATFKKFIETGQVPAPGGGSGPVFDRYQITTYWLTIFDSPGLPGAKPVQWLPKDTILEVDRVQNGWAHFASPPERWANMKWLIKVV